MKAATAPLIALLNGDQQFEMADVITFTLASGTALRYAIYDIDLPHNSYSFSSDGPVIERGRVRTVLGLEVDTLELTVTPKSTDAISGVPWIQAAAKGYLDGATVLLERVFMSSPGVVVGGVVTFSGRVADLDNASRVSIDITVKSDIELLNVQMPRNLYQPGCMHTLFDADCGLNRATFAVTSAVTTATVSVINCGLAQADGYFDMGYVLFTSGVAAGLKRTVRSYVTGSLTLLNPLPVAPSPGDSFTAYPGCDKRQATCSGKFSNLTNFRGFPYVPAPEATL